MFLFSEQQDRELELGQCDVYRQEFYIETLPFVWQTITEMFAWLRKPILNFMGKMIMIKSIAVMQIRIYTTLARQDFMVEEYQGQGPIEEHQGPEPPGQQPLLHR